MDGWIELSGCGKWMWMWIVESGKVDSGLSGCGCGKWKVEGGAVPDLTPRWRVNLNGPHS